MPYTGSVISSSSVCTIECFLSFCNGGGIGDGVQFTRAEWPVFLRPFQCVACRSVFQLWGIVFVVLFLFYASVVYFVIRHGTSSWLPSAGIWRICELFFFHHALHRRRAGAPSTFVLSCTLNSIHMFVRKLLLFLKPTSMIACE